MTYYKKIDSLGTTIDYIITDKAPEGYVEMSQDEIDDILNVSAIIDDDPEFL